MLRITLLLLLSTIYMNAQSPQSSEGIIQFADTSRLLKNASVSLFAVHCGNGTVLLDKSGHKVLASASNLKVVTSAVVIETLGSYYRFETKIYLSGKAGKAGVWQGDLIIEPSGDPTLGSTFIEGILPLDTLVIDILNRLKEMSINTIDGRILFNLSGFHPQSIPNYWPYIDIGNYYGAGVHKMTVHDNLYEVFFKPGENVGDPAMVLRTEPEVSTLKFINRMKTGREGSGDNGYIYPLPGKAEYLLQGTIPAGVEEFSIKGSMPDPAEFFANYVINKAKELNIEIKGGIAFDSTGISTADINTLTHIKTNLSPPMHEIVRIINKRSNNLFTEQVLAMLGYQQGEFGTDAGLKVLYSFLKEKQIYAESLSLQDGSGLSRNNMISARTIVELLKYMALSGTAFNEYYSSFPIAGDTADIGGFKKFGLGTVIAENARIKSGTINGVRSFSGYIHNIKGELIAFSFLVNNYSGRSGEVDAWFKELLLSLAES